MRVGSPEQLETHETLEEQRERILNQYAELRQKHCPSRSHLTPAEIDKIVHAINEVADREKRCIQIANS
jgi:hypothetical protein